MYRIALWTIAIVTFGIGDLATTWYGIYVATGVVEYHPIHVHTIGLFGFLPVVGFKVAAFGVLIALYRSIDGIERIGVPIGLALFGTAVVAWNITVIT